jgi:hypothetical protein
MLSSRAHDQAGNEAVNSGSLVRQQTFTVCFLHPISQSSGRGSWDSEREMGYDLFKPNCQAMKSDGTNG